MTYLEDPVLYRTLFMPVHVAYEIMSKHTERVHEKSETPRLDSLKRCRETEKQCNRGAWTRGAHKQHRALPHTNAIDKKFYITGGGESSSPFSHHGDFSRSR